MHDISLCMSVLWYCTLQDAKGQETTVEIDIAGEKVKHTMLYKSPVSLHCHNLNFIMYVHD